MARDEDTVVYMTKTGKKITAEMCEQWAAEAEIGYEIDQLKRARREPSADVRQAAGFIAEQYEALTQEGLPPDVAIRIITTMMKQAAEDLTDD